MPSREMKGGSNRISAFSRLECDRLYTSDCNIDVVQSTSVTRLPGLYPVISITVIFCLGTLSAGF
jgi:hypothetical protein